MTDLFEILVLDEADRMLDMGFHDDIKHIISMLPQQRQTLLFSATYPDEIKAISKTIQIKSEDKIVLKSFKVNAEKGFNFEKYDLTFSEKGLKAYQKKHKGIKIDKRKNDKYYLPKGTYTIELEGVTKVFKIK